MVLQTGSQFTRFGQTALTGDVVAIALVRELGPTLTGILVAGRSASGIASELGLDAGDGNKSMPWRAMGDGPKPASW